MGKETGYVGRMQGMAMKRDPELTPRTTIWKITYLFYNHPFYYSFTYSSFRAAFTPVILFNFFRKASDANDSDPLMIRDPTSSSPCKTYSSSDKISTAKRGEIIKQGINNTKPGEMGSYIPYWDSIIMLEFSGLYNCLL